MSTPSDIIARGVRSHLNMQYSAWKAELARLEPDAVAARRTELLALLAEVEKDEITLKVARPIDTRLITRNPINETRDRENGTGISGPNPAEGSGDSGIPAGGGGVVPARQGNA